MELIRIKIQIINKNEEKYKKFNISKKDLKHRILSSILLTRTYFNGK